MSLLTLMFKVCALNCTTSSASPARRTCAAAAALTFGLAVSSATQAFNTTNPEPYLPELTETVLVRDYPVVRNEMTSENNLEQERIRQISSLVKHGLENADSQALGYAQGLLNYWQQVERVPTEVRLYRAIIAQQQHHFDQALHELNIVLKYQPQHIQAHATRAAIHLTMGHYDQAAQDCRATAFTVDPLQTANCLAQVQGPRGHAHEMLESLEKLLSINPNIDSDMKREVLTTLGDLHASMNNQAKASIAYSNALDISPNHPYLVAQFSEFLIQHESFAELENFLLEKKSTLSTRIYQAIAKKNAVQEVKPQSTDLFTAKNSVLEGIGKELESIRKELEAIDLREDTDTAKYWVLYFIYIEPDNKQALHYAQLNWQTQKSLSDARLLKQAAEVANDTKTLSSLQDWLTERNIVDTRLTENTR